MGSTKNSQMKVFFMDELWKVALDEIEIEVTKPVFLTFFKRTKLILFEENIVTIASPTPMISTYIEQRYTSLIKKILDKKTGSNIHLIFISNESEKASEKNNPGPLFSTPPAKAVAPVKRPARIRMDYTFESFAVSESNQLAYTAAQTVASSPGNKYNPVFLYGTVGVGKTHLMHSIANQIITDNPRSSILYLTTEEFTNEVVEAIRDKSTTNLRKKFRNVDLLLLDDVQFLSGKEKVQEELFHTFNTLIEKGKQVIFSSDRPPSEIPKIEERLASRFEGGLNVDIEPPDFELRTAILLTKSEKFNLQLNHELAKFAAERISDTRALEGFLLRLDSVINIKHEPLNKATILTILGKTREPVNIFKPDNVIDTICSYYNIKPTQLKGSKRDASLVRARHMCMYLLKEESKLTFVEIGNILGGRDHTTVMHAVEKITGLLSNQDEVNGEIVTIKRRLKDDFLQ